MRHQREPRGNPRVLGYHGEFMGILLGSSLGTYFKFITAMRETITFTIDG